MTSPSDVEHGRTIVALRAGQVLHYGGGFLIDRLQRVGAQEPNRQREKVYEVGNYQSTGQTSDTPRMNFDLESTDASTEIEALLVGLDPTGLADGQELKLTNAKPLDVVSAWKAVYGAFDANSGVIVPQLLLDSATWRFGIRQTATKAFTLQGDSIYYVTEGIPRQESFAGAGVGPYNFSNTPAIPTTETGVTFHAYTVCVIYADGSYRRLFIGEDYTDTTAGFTLTDAALAPVGSTVHCTYASDDGPVSFDQLIHPTSTVKPSGVRHKDIDIYVSDGAATPQLIRWRGVQNFDWNWRVNREPDEELGNAHYVANDFDVPEVSGSITLRSTDAVYLMERIAQVLGVSVGETANVLADVPLELEAVIRHPDTGDVLETLWTPDARFNPPGSQANANAKIDSTFTWSSDSGDMSVFVGARP